MQNVFLLLIYLIFFLSGAAALIYEVVWVRYLGLVFGGSHLAVTTVLAVFMGGLALGGYLIGRITARCSNLLRLYGILELGIALSALLFAILLKIYPSIYVPLARFAEASPVYLTFLRVCFGLLCLILPTTLMGGTLPVLSSLVSKNTRSLGVRLSFLYGFNTLGAVAGASTTGFFLLRHLSIGETMCVAVILNIVLGLLAILLQNRITEPAEDLKPEASVVATATTYCHESPSSIHGLPFRLILWGIGISGFCALAYEVLWTRVLSVAIGASTYGFTIILVSFLTGIAIGSGTYGASARIFDSRNGTLANTMRTIVGFGSVQIVIGLSALLVTAHLGDLPAHSVFLEKYFQGVMADHFAARQWAGMALAFSYMFVPAFFMGVAFPMAGKVHATFRGTIGNAVGEVLAFNTVGAIFGSAASGFILIYLIGIERSLQVITLVNIGYGVMVIASIGNRRPVVYAAAFLSMAAISTLIIFPNKWRLWDARFLAMYQANSPRGFRTAKATKDTLKNTSVLYYGEGAQAIVSSVRGKAGNQAFITNGRVEASNDPGDMQCQYTLGHLPMLLCRNPRKVFVLGTGSGMTLGATSVYPSVESITLAEIEPKVLGVAKSFARYNHSALDNPKLRIVFNDGRNFLLTTREKFDVITADPVHPWFSGAGYIYTTEYFRLASQHLNPGGVICQWLPIYEMTGDNLKSVVTSFMANFRYTMIWMTQYDAELVGSNSPFAIDEEELSRRIAMPDVQHDLKQVGMGSAEAFLSYFVMGTRGAAAYARGGRVNTDDNLYLEFSAPESIGDATLDSRNFLEIVGHRENILPYLKTPSDPITREAQVKRWNLLEGVAPLVDRLHGIYLSGAEGSPGFKMLMARLEAASPDYAPWIYLRGEYRKEKEREPRLLRQTAVAFVNEKGEQDEMVISAVISRLSKEYAVVDFVDNRARFIFGSAEIYGENRDDYIKDMTESTLERIREGIGDSSRSKDMSIAERLRPELKRIVKAELEHYAGNDD